MNIIKKWLKSRIQDSTAKRLAEENLLEFNQGKTIPMINKIPLAGVLEKIGVKVVDYRIPNEKDFFISLQNRISFGNVYINDVNQCGYRFILEPINQKPSQKTATKSAEKTKALNKKGK